LVPVETSTRLPLRIAGEIGQRLARTRTGFDQQDAAAVQRARDRRGHVALPLARLEARHLARQRSLVGEDPFDGLAQAQASLSG
jgi:hypothetical protein